MAPPGRRRDARHALPSFLSILLFLVLYISSPAFAASAVLGIDIGTEYIKAALVKPGIPLDIVVTKDSKRKEVAAIAFKPPTTGPQDGNGFPERLYGSDAMALMSRFPSDVYPNLKPLLSETDLQGPMASIFRTRYPGLRLIETRVNGTVGMKCGSFNPEDPPFMVEELLAMQLKNIRQNAESMAGKGSSIRDVVITVPAFYTADERRAVRLAADMAGLEVIGLISDGMAIGLNYAMPRKFPNVNKGELAEHHLIYDMGAGSTTATILKFQARDVKDVGRFNKTIQEAIIVGTGWNRILGGDTLNHLIVDDMVDTFVASERAKKYEVSDLGVLQHGRAMARLWKEAERIRQVLSANTATSARLEELYLDIDFSYKITRERFEALAASYVNQVGLPIEEALGAAGLTYADLDSVVLHGGAVRTPFIQKALEGLIGDAAKLRSNVNADEAAVFGAGFKAAGLSPSFKVKEIRDSDSAGYGAIARWTANGDTQNQRIFEPTSQIGSEVAISLPGIDDASLSIEQEIPAGSDIKLTPILRVEFANLTTSLNLLKENYGCKPVNITMGVIFRLDSLTGLPEVSNAAIHCETDLDKKGSFADGVKGFFGFGSKKDQEVIVEDDAPSSKKATTAKANATSSAAADTVPKNETEMTIPKSKLKIVPLSFTSTPQGRPQPGGQDLQRIRDRLDAFDRSDKNRRLREEAINALEGYTYRARDWLADGAFKAVSTISQRAAIESAIAAASDWLYGDGVNAGLEIVRDKLKELQDLVKPIQLRKREVSGRPEGIALLQGSLNQTLAMLSTIRSNLEAAASASSESMAAASSAGESTASVVESFMDDASSAETAKADESSYIEGESTATSSSSSSTSSTVTTPSPLPFYPTYTEADLEELGVLYATVNDWFTEKLAEQKMLSETDDPVLLSTELKTKSEQLQKSLTDLIYKRIRIPLRTQSSSKKKTTKTKTTKTKSTKSKSTESPVASAEPEPGDSESSEAEEPPTATASPSEGESPSVEMPRDEL